jgi:peptidoglycan/xylan/chitin deacetylase (PgdA/CDA1 family)
MRAKNLSVETMSKDQAAQPRRKLYLLYHELRPYGSRYSYAIENELFTKHVELFAQLRESIDVLYPEITFDDGHSSNFEYALPILESRNLKAHFFITAGWTGSRSGFMGWDELRFLQKAGHTIGAHGWSHTLLTHCDVRQLQKELDGARKKLEDRLGAVVKTMSLPGGRYNRRILGACEQAGYTQIYTSIPRSEPTPPGSMIGRLNIRGDMTPEWLAKLLDPKSGVLTSLGRQYRWKEVAKTILGDRMYERAWALLNGKEPDVEGSEAATE